MTASISDVAATASAGRLPTRYRVALPIFRIGGIRRDFLEYTVDRNPYKQGRFLPGTRIPIHPVEKIAETRPDFLLILPWNFKEEIMTQMSFIRDWGGRFVVPIPEVRVYA